MRVPHTVAAVTKSEEHKYKPDICSAGFRSSFTVTSLTVEIQLRFNHLCQGNTQNSHCGFRIHAPDVGCLSGDRFGVTHLAAEVLRMAVFCISAMLKTICILPLLGKNRPKGCRVNRRYWISHSWPFWVACMVWLYKPSRGGLVELDNESWFHFGGCGQKYLCVTPDQTHSSFHNWEVKTINCRCLKGSKWYIFNAVNGF